MYSQMIHVHLIQIFKIEISIKSYFMFLILGLVDLLFLIGFNDDFDAIQINQGFSRNTTQRIS